MVNVAEINVQGIQLLLILDSTPQTAVLESFESIQYSPMFFYVSGPPAVQGAMRDIAEGQMVTMDDAETSPELAVDGDVTTCAKTSTEIVDTRLTIDLGDRRTITSVVIDAGE